MPGPQKVARCGLDFKLRPVKMSATRFRSLIVLALALPIAGSFADLAFPHLISERLAKAIAAEPLARAFDTWLGIGLIGAWALASLAGVMGLFIFKPWARPLTLWLTIFGFAIYPTLGSTAASWLASALTEAGAIAWGGDAGIRVLGTNSLEVRSTPVRCLSTCLAGRRRTQQVRYLNVRC